MPANHGLNMRITGVRGLLQCECTVAIRDGDNPLTTYEDINVTRCIASIICRCSEDGGLCEFGSTRICLMQSQNIKFSVLYPLRQSTLSILTLLLDSDLMDSNAI